MNGGGLGQVQEIISKFSCSFALDFIVMGSAEVAGIVVRAAWISQIRSSVGRRDSDKSSGGEQRLTGAGFARAGRANDRDDRWIRGKFGGGSLPAIGAASAVLTIEFDVVVQDLTTGIINGDFADVEAVLRNGGEALIGTGAGRGEEAVMDALRKALACPLLERAQSGAAANVMVSITADWEVMEASAIETAMNYLQDHYDGRPDIKACTVEGEGMEDRVLVTVLASGFDQEERLLEERRISLHLGSAPDSALPHAYASAPLQAQPLPANVVSGRVYGEVAAGEHGPTPTRLLPQAPTPSGELPGVADDLHVPAIIRMGQGRLIE